MSDYEQLKAAIDAKMSTNPQIRHILKLLENGKATFNDSAKYAQILSHLLGRELASQILGLSDREGTTTQLLRGAYDEVNGLCSQVQRSLDKKAGIGLNPKQAPFPAERVEQYAHSLVDPTVEDKVIKRRAGAGSETITKSYHDDFIETNAEFREDAGMKCYIIRMGTDCCQWCSDVAGKYEMKDQPQGIFRRHDNCDCTIIYDGQVLRGQTGAEGKRGKKWVEVPKKVGAADAVRFTQEKAKVLNFNYSQKNKPIINNPEMHSIKGKMNSFVPSVNMDCVSGSKPIAVGLQKELSNEYDKFEAQFGTLDNVRVVTAVPYNNDEVWGAYNDNSNELFLFGIGGQTGKSNMAKIARKKGSKGVWSTESPYHAFRHELGHAWQNKQSKIDPLFSQKIEKIQNIRDEINNKINISLTDGSDNDIINLRKSFLSDYGLDPDNDIDEFISECIAEYCNGSPRETSRTVIDILFAKEL